MDIQRFALLLLEDDEDEDIIVQLLSEKRASISRIYKTRPEEGYFNILIRTHLTADEEKFRQFFRLNQNQFNFVLKLVDGDLTKPYTHFVKIPISPQEKLAVTLR